MTAQTYGTLAEKGSTLVLQDLIDLVDRCQVAEVSRDAVVKAVVTFGGKARSLEVKEVADA